MIPSHMSPNMWDHKPNTFLYIIQRYRCHSVFFCVSPVSSSAADTAFDAVIGFIEDIIMSMHFIFYHFSHVVKRIL